MGRSGLRHKVRVRLTALAVVAWICLISAPLLLKLPSQYQRPRLWGHLLTGLAGLAGIGMVHFLLRRSENDRGESEGALRALLEGLPDGVARFDREGRHLFASRNVEEVVGIPASRFLGRTHRELGFPEDLCQLWEQAIRRVFESGAPHETEFCLGERIFNWRLVPERNAQGGVRSVLTICREMTAHRRAEEDYQTLFREMLDGFALHQIILDQRGLPADYRFLRVNPAFERLTGLKAEQLIGRSVLEVLPGTERHWIELYGRVAQSGELVFSRQYHAQLGKHFEVTAFRTAPGQFACIFADVSEQVRAEEQLRLSERRFRETLEKAQIIAVELDGEGRVAFCNDFLLHLTGYREAQVLGQDWFLTFIPEGSRERLRAVHAQNLSGNPGFVRCENPILTAQGELRHIRWTNTPIHDREGRVTSVASLGEDVTENRAAEARLQASEARFRSIFDESPISIWEEDFSAVRARFGQLAAAGVTDLRAHLEAHPREVQALAGLVRIVEFNNASMRLLGARRKEEVFRELPRYFHDASLAVFKEEMIALAQGAIRFESEIPILDVAGNPMTLELRLAVLPGSEASLSRVFVSFIDITEKEKLRQQLMQTQRMESVGRLAGGVAHDFNNMLGVILGHAELALSRIDPQDGLRADLEQIQLAGQRSADLTGQLLAFARRQVASPKVVGLNSLVEGMLRMLRRLIGENIELDWRPAEELWQVRVDPSQIDQIVANLCVNARDAIGGAGRIGIQTSNAELDAAYCARHPGSRPGQYAMLAVSDDGCGMEQAVLEHLFEPFFTTKGVGRGTGLGLATVYGIVKQNQGYIEVSSAPERGTCFRIYLPRIAAEAEQAEAGTGAGAERGRGETVLLVEDETMILNMGRAMLERLGYRVLPAASAEEALRLAGGGSFDLLLTDVVMPRINGWELARQLAAKRPGLRCLFMSGYAAEVLAPGLERGTHFIQKPFSIQDLAARVREALDEARTGLTARAAQR